MSAKFDCGTPRCRARFLGKNQSLHATARRREANKVEEKVGKKKTDESEFYVFDA